MILGPHKLRRMPQAQAVCQLMAQIAAGGLEPLKHFSGLFLVIDRDVDLGVVQIGCRLHAGHGNHCLLYAGVLQRPQQIGQLPLDFFVDSTNSVGWHIGSSFQSEMKISVGDMKYAPHRKYLRYEVCSAHVQISSLFFLFVFCILTALPCKVGFGCVDRMYQNHAKLSAGSRKTLMVCFRQALNLMQQIQPISGLTRFFACNLKLRNKIGFAVRILRFTDIYPNGHPAAPDLIGDKILPLAL